MDTTTIHIIRQWTFVAISLSAVVCIFYQFVKVFIKNKIIRFALVGLMVALCVFWYIESHKSPDVIIMREDTLYILPETD
jgi:hypothetical protein